MKMVNLLVAMFVKLEEKNEKILELTKIQKDQEIKIITENWNKKFQEVSNIAQPMSLALINNSHVKTIAECDDEMNRALKAAKKFSQLTCEQSE